jgi:hypothetical protein
MDNNELEMSSGQDRSLDLTSVGGIIFKELSHTYTNGDGIRYTGITTLLGRFHDHFDADKTSINKSIKDNVIQYFGAKMYSNVKSDSGGEGVIQENYEKLKASLGTNYEYQYLNIINQVIKDVTIREYGEEKYMALEKQTRGFDKLYTKLNKIKATRPDFYREIETEALKESSIAKYGGEKYKVLAKSVNGFDNLGTQLETFEKKMPKLYKKIMKRIPELKQEWIDTNLRAVTEGSAEHDKREQKIYDDGGYEWNGIWFEYIEGKNIMTVTDEDTCVIPECMVWNHEMKLGGLADIFLFHKGTIYVLDYKTNATVDLEPKISNKKYWTYMTGVCSELLDLNFYHYSLQLKIYQEMALMLRPDFKAGVNIIIHTTSDTHYRYEDAIIECHDVSEIVPKMFDQLRDEMKNVA